MAIDHGDRCDDRCRPETTAPIMWFLSGRISRPKLPKIAALPFISSLNLQPDEAARSLNYNNRAAHGPDALGASAGRNLQGRQVTVGVGDNSDVYTHIDFTGGADRPLSRIRSIATEQPTTGTRQAGAGLLDPRYKGMAPQATIVSQFFTDILSFAPTYIADYNMVLTNNSYTDAVAGCPGEGEYDATSNYLDAQLAAYPHLLHVFAVGNDGFAEPAAPWEASPTQGDQEGPVCRRS